MTELTFLQDPKTQDAVVRNFEIMGEAAHKIELHHAALANYGNPDERAKSANLSIAAQSRKASSQSALDAVNARKAAILAKLQSNE